MIRIDDVRKFPIMIKNIMVPQNEEQKYNIIFMSENSTFMEAYRYLKIRPFFVKRITAVPNRIPRLIATLGTLAEYKTLGLIPIMDVKQHNAFIDTTPFFNLISATYGPLSYKQPVVATRVINYFNDCRSVGENRKNILIYHINLNSKVPKNIYLMKAFVLIRIARLGEGSFPFDNVILAIQDGGTVKYTCIYSKSIQFAAGKIMSIFKYLIGQEDILEVQPEPKEIVPNKIPDGYQITSDVLNANEE